jgi:heme/copper-type cytochrome/quinol oxidase subunit 2
MFDLEEKVDAAVKMAICAAALTVTAIAGAFFLCLALFVWTQQRYGTVAASLVLASVFIIAAVTALLFGLMARQRSQERQHRNRQHAAQWWSDPTVIATGLEVFRIIGSKRLITVLLGAFVVGALLERPRNRHPSAEL